MGAAADSVPVRLAADRVRPGLSAHGRRRLAVPPEIDAAPGRHAVPPAAAVQRRHLFSLGHGGNDAQKTMGIIVLLLTAAGICRTAEPGGSDPILQLATSTSRPGGSSSLCHAAIALGTVFGGWRIVKTMGSGITKLQPVGGFCAELAAADDDHRRHPLRHPDQHHPRHHRQHPRRRHDPPASDPSAGSGASGSSSPGC